MDVDVVAFVDVVDVVVAAGVVVVVAAAAAACDADALSSELDAEIGHSNIKLVV